MGCCCRGNSYGKERRPCDPSLVKEGMTGNEDREKTAPHKALVNVLGVVYLHTKTDDGGDLYFLPVLPEPIRNISISKTGMKSWFTRHRVRQPGTSSVYRGADEGASTAPAWASSSELPRGRRRPDQHPRSEEFVTPSSTAPGKSSPWSRRWATSRSASGSGGSGAAAPRRSTCRLRECSSGRADVPRPRSTASACATSGHRPRYSETIQARL